MSSFKINAVIVTYNRIDLLKECIASLENQTYPLNKIIIVDNFSNDGTREFLKENYSSDSRFVIEYMDYNKGGSGGFYEGIKKASKYKCDWIWLMDDDTIPFLDALEKMIKNEYVINNIEKIGFLSSNVLWRNEEAGLINIPTPDKNYNKFLKFNIVKIKCSTFVSFLVRKEVVEKVGLPYKEFFIWGDDTEYSERIQSYGFENYLINNSNVIHKRDIGCTNSIINENNINRLWLYKYDVRNHMYLAKKKGVKNLVKHIIISSINFLKIMKPSTKYKYKKIKIYLINSVSGLLFNPKIDKL